MTEAQIDKRGLRSVLGSFVTGVTIITTVDGEGVPYGLTANSFSSVSLEPPLVLWSQSLAAPSYPAFRDAERFAVSILSEHQTELSSKFAKSATDKFDGVDTFRGLGGIPLIKGACAYLECRKVTSYPGGDHAVFLGEVERMERSSTRPLVFGGGRYLVAYPHDLGGFSLDLGVANIDHLHAVRLGSAAIAELASEIGTTTALGVWGNKGPTIVRWEESARPVAASLRTGLVLPIMRSAAGQIFGAFLPRELTGPILDPELEEAAAAEPRAFQYYSSRDAAEEALDFGDYLPDEMAGEFTRVDLGRVAEESRRSLRLSRAEAERILADVRTRGLARNIDLEPDVPSEDKIAVVAAPVFNRDGLLVLAVAAAAHGNEIESWKSPVVQAVRRAGETLSRRLGHDS